MSTIHSTLVTLSCLVLTSQLQPVLHNCTEPNVVTLTTSNFDTLVTNSADPWLVLFYSPWCEVCKEFKPDYCIIAQKLQVDVKAGQVDSLEEYDLKERFGVRKYPTLIVFKKEKTYPTFYRGHWIKEDVMTAVGEILELNMSRVTH